MQRAMLHAFRIAAGLTASIIASLAIEIAVSRPGMFRAMAAMACMMVVSVVVAREIAGRRLGQATVGASLGRWLAGFVALTAWEYGSHNYLGVPFSAIRAMAAGGVLVTIAASTAVILAGTDRAFAALVQPHDT
jgi:hypothetical protein